MQPLDKITDYDWGMIKNYITAATGAMDIAPASVVLKEWNKSKRTLFKALGGNLRVSIPIKLQVDIMTKEYRIREIYRPWVIHIWNQADWNWYNTISRIQNEVENPAIAKLYYYAFQHLTSIEIKRFTCLFSMRSVESNSYHNIYDERGIYKFDSLGISVKNGMKNMKLIQRICKKMNYPYMEEIQEWMNQINHIREEQEWITNLVISIHPIDFMSMSDNTCNWRSCFHWINTDSPNKTYGGGGYSTSPIELMNSNVAAILYLEHPTKKYVLNNYEIPNKMQRQVVYIHKDILCLGKTYPGYGSVSTESSIRKQTFKVLTKMLEENLHWTYQWKNQEYKDLMKYYSSEYVRDSKYTHPDRLGKLGKHNILLVSNIMYNDMIHDHYTSYYCCRNYVKKPLRLNVCGKATCMCCGKPMDINYSSESSRKICWHCQHAQYTKEK